MSFAKEFAWGAATASYQIEGAAHEDGKGLSVWDMMCRQPGKIWSGNTAEVACDHYHRFQEDIRLMAEIGLRAYRFSISWPRVMPEGTDRVNAKGLAFYDQLIDLLLANKVVPWVTLFHWDYPYSLYCKGGWLNRDSADWFAEYARVVADKLSDRVTHWITQNEPQCYIGLGHEVGYHAPGLKLGFAEVLLAAHHSLLAHGKAVQAIRASAKSKPSIGAALVGFVNTPHTEAPEDIEAARNTTFSITEKTCVSNNTWFSDPMILGRYPEDGVELFRREMPDIKDGDMQIICQPLDFYGINIYTGGVVAAEDSGNHKQIPSVDGPALTTMMEWEVTPEVLYWGPRFFYERYSLPVVITENGMSNTDWVHADGKVHDPQRIDFLTRYLRAYRRSVADGVEAQGYFIWTLMDNFEWALGYRQRFGLVYVDYASGKRTLKDSAYWYRDLISSNGDILVTTE